jgi:alkanesulfonate monooxygenase SsuD/methylene tetrahydromethanopterin reductase-like flavin-dependent oxidoreductase (luciferase family)/predicted kinase
VRSLPSPCLVVLVGPVASGKTTWARTWFESAQVVSSDALRALVGEAEHDVAASDDAFAVLDDVVARRLRRGLTTVVDSLGLDAAARTRWRRSAVEAGVPATAVLFDTPAADCRRRNAARPVPVPPDVVRRQLTRWADVVAEVRAEPWSDVLDAEPVAVVAPSLATPARRASGRARRVDPITRGDDGGEKSMRFGLHLSSVQWPGGRVAFADDLRRIAHDAEAAGVEHLWVMDHLRQIPQVGPAWHDLPEPFTTLAWLAAETERARLGVLVSPAFLRPPAVLAKLVASLDVLSGGRAMCGLGVGWFRQEYEAAGIAFPGLAARYDHLADALRALPLIWGKGAPSFTGRRTTITEALCYPRPIQEHVPIWVGGSGRRRTLRLVAEHADACNLFGEPADVADAVHALRRHAADAGRDPAGIRVTHLSTVLIGRDPDEVTALVDRLRPRRTSRERFARHVHAGTLEQHRDRVERYAAAGVDTMILRLADVAEPGALERLARLCEVTRSRPVVNRT